MKQELIQRLNDLSKLKAQIKLSLNKANLGNLQCTTSHGTHQYRLNGAYLTKKKLHKAQSIAQRDYNKQVIEIIESEINTIQTFLDNHNEDRLKSIYNDLPTGRRVLVNPIIPPVEVKIQAFLAEEYDPLPFRSEDNSEIITENSERVRSKSEKMIADKLHTLGIPYRYEKPLSLTVAGHKKIFRPDFTIMNKRTGKTIYLEHFGMMDNPEYCSNAINKIEIYEKNGYLLGDKLLITKETSQAPLNTSVMEEYFIKFLT